MDVENGYRGIPTEIINGLENPNSSKVEITHPEELQSPEALKYPEELIDGTLMLLSSPNPEEELGSVLEHLGTTISKSTYEELPELKDLKKKQQEKYKEHRRIRLDIQRSQYENGKDYKENTLSSNELHLVSCSNFLPTINNEEAILNTSFNATGGESPLTSVHFSMNHSSGESKSMSGITQSWRESNTVFVLPYTPTVEKNGAPEAFLPEDCWWGIGCGEGMKIPKGTTILTNRDVKESYVRSMEKMGITIKEVTERPFDLVGKTLQEKGAKEIFPEEFPNPEKFAVENDTFYGHHDPYSLHQDSAEYYRNTGRIGINVVDQDVCSYTEKFNNPQTESSERHKLLLKLLEEGYFEHSGCLGISLNYEHLDEEVKGFILDYLSLEGNDEEAEEKGYFDFVSKPENKEKLKDFKQGLLKLANNPDSKLQKYSKGYFRKRLEKVKGLAGKVDAQLLGMFLASRYKELTESYKSWD